MRVRNLCNDIESKYVYDTTGRLSRLLVKTDCCDEITKYVYGRGLLGHETNGTFKTYHYDCRGSTVAITNGAGVIIDTFEYDTYGKLISRTGTVDTPFLYNGRDGVMTDHNGLIYMRNRYYSPLLRRFVNADVLHGDIADSTSLNRYAYVNGNPVSFVDPFGLVADGRLGSSGGTSRSGWYGTVSGIGHFVLDIAGLIPVYGAIADGANTLWYLGEGNWLDAGLSALSLIPVTGIVSGGGKMAKSGLNVIGLLDDTTEAVVKATKTFDADTVYRAADTLAETIEANAKYYPDVDTSSLLSMSREELAQWATTGTPYEVGRKGEFLAKIVPEDKVAIKVGEQVRIPDGLGNGTLTEVKNVSVLYNTPQLRDLVNLHWINL